jgi:hypothetical protein
MMSNFTSRPRPYSSAPTETATRSSAASPSYIAIIEALTRRNDHTNAGTIVVPDPFMVFREPTRGMIMKGRFMEFVDLEDLG